MKLQRLALFTVLTGLLLALPAASAVAGETAATLDRKIVDDVLWVEASVEDGSAERVVIKITAPQARTSQVCKLAFTGEGTYRCGIHVDDASSPREASRTFHAKVLLDGEVVAAARIRL